MQHADNEYLGLLKRIKEEGTVKQDRTGTGTISLFGPQIEFDLQQGFPLLTLKRTPFRIMLEELMWFKNGDTNLKTLLEKNVKIWNDDAYRDYVEKGGSSPKEEFLESVLLSDDGYDMGPIYGKQWVHWETVNGQTIDQLEKVIEGLKNDPDSRRHLVTAWNPGEVDQMALPPCHILFQFYIENNRLSCKMYQRSVDTFLGLPLNIASYAAKTYTIAKMLGLDVGRLIVTMGDAHIYLNHLEQVEELFSRTPKPLPTLIVKTAHESIKDYTIDDYELVGYDPHPTIKGQLSVGL